MNFTRDDTLQINSFLYTILSFRMGMHCACLCVCGVYMYVHVCMRTRVCVVYVCMCTYRHVHMEADITHLPLLLFSLVLETGSLTEPGIHGLTSGFQGSSCLCPPALGL